MDRENADIETLVAKTLERTSGELDARVVRSVELVAGIESAVREIDGPAAPRRSWRRAAAIAACVLVAATLVLVPIGVESGWFGRERRGSGGDDATPGPGARPQSANSPVAPAAVDDEGRPSRERSSAPTAERAVDRPTEEDSQRDRLAALAEQAPPDRESTRRPGDRRGRIADSFELDALQSVQSAPFIVRLQAAPERSGGPKSQLRPIAKVVGLYRGNPAAIGTRIELLHGGDSTHRSFLDHDPDSAFVPFTEGATFIACLRAGAKKNGVWPEQFEIAFGEGWSCTLVSDGLPYVAPRDDERLVVDALRRDLVASLDDESVRVRLSAITALHHFDGEPSTIFLPARLPNLWKDAAARLALLRAGDDEDPRIRWHVAWMDPASIVGPGLALARRMAFDADPLVRKPAVESLLRHGDQKLDADVSWSLQSFFEDRPFDEFTSGVLRERAPLTDPTEIEKAANELLIRGERGDRIAAAWRLGDVGETDATSGGLVVRALAAAFVDPEMEVRRAAAASFGRVAAPQRVDLLQSISRNDDPRVVAMVAVAQFRLGDARAFRILQLLVNHNDLGDARDWAHRNDVLAALEAVELLAPLVDSADHAEGLQILIQAAGNPHPLVRGRALVALARQTARLDRSDHPKIEALVDGAMSDGSGFVRAAAAVARELFDRGVALLADALGYGR